MITVLGTVLLSALLCRVYLGFARARHILDTPNERSSHSLATPSGGGLALMLAFIFGLLMAAWVYGAWNTSFVTLSVAALVLATLGFIDDLCGLSMRLRLLVYSLICVLVSIVLLQPVLTEPVLSGLTLVLLASGAMLWSLNLYNFMDGIDGIAAMQAVLACCGAAWLSWVSVHDSSYLIFCLVLAAAHGGFLVWNFPPARLFMGDAGSVPTGLLLAGLVILGMVQGQLNPFCWLVLLAIFVTDASWTLLWRMATGQRFTQPHRLHAYQRLSRHWNSHLKVDMLLLAISVLWLFPIALAVLAWPDHALFMVILAYLPLVSGMAKIGRLA
jgi:Fuc2NAc and GlcNAc transferase